MKSWEDALRREAEQKTRHIGPDNRVRTAATASENDDFAAVPQKRGLFAGRRSPAPGRENGAEKGKKSLQGVFLRHKRSLAVAASTLALAAVLAVTLIAGLWKGGAGDPVPQEKLVSACTLEINPAVLFLVDDGQKVTSVKALNADADVLLSEEGAVDALVGKDLSEAVVSYADRAFRLGYIDPAKTENAVRLCRTETAGDTTTAARALSGYFREKGILSAVLERSLDKTSLSSLVGADDTLSADALSDAVAALPSLFGERSLAGKTADELKKEYRTEVEENYLYSLTLSRLSENIAKLERCSTLLLRISDLNTQIIYHEGNPMLLMKDYWSVKEYGKTSEDVEFNALMQETEQTLAEYEAAGGEAIESFSALCSTVSDYADLQSRCGDIQNLILTISAAQFPEYAQSLLGVLKSIGCDVSRLEMLLSLPTTVEEFVQRLCISLSGTAEQRAADYHAVYETAREPLSEEAYDAYLAGLTEKYGSLDAFWEQLHAAG